MRWIPILALFLLAGFSAPALAGDDSELEAGGYEFDATSSVQVDGTAMEMRCTGVALRKKWFFKVYAIAAYLDAGTETGIDAGATWVATDSARRLHLHMLRGVDSEKITSSIDEALEKCSTTPLDAVAAERTQFMEAFSMEKLEKGQDIFFSWVPGSGLVIEVDGQKLTTIESPAFARSFFEVYFGPNPVNDGMKKDLLKLVS